MRYLLTTIILLASFGANAAGVKRIEGVTFAYTASVDGVNLEYIAGVDGQAPVLEVLCGVEQSPGLDNSGSFRLLKCTSISSGVALFVGVMPTQSGTFSKVALYADAGAAPGSRISYSNTSMPCSEDIYNKLPIPRVAITGSTVYWVANVCNGSGCLSHHSGQVGYSFKFKGIADYGAFTFPDPAGSGFSTADPYGLGLVLYGYAE